MNILELVGETMGLHRVDRYKQLKIMQNADLIIAECHDLIAQHGLDVAAARDVVVKAMLEDQPLPLKDGGVTQASMRLERRAFAIQAEWPMPISQATD